MSVAAFTETAGILDRSKRAKITATGDQALWFFDQLVTNQVVALEAGQGLEAMLLTPKGRITAVMRILSAGRAAFVDLDPAGAEDLTSFFQSRIFATQVKIEDSTERLGIVSVLGPRADEIVRRALVCLGHDKSEEARSLGCSLPGDEEHAIAHFGIAALVRVRRPTIGIDLWLARTEVETTIAAVEAAGGERVSEGEYEALCVLAGLGRFGVDFDEHYLPQEAAMERAVHFQKGCYLGQEAVAMAQRGRVKRRLRHLRFEGAPILGEIFQMGEEMGWVTSIAAGLSGGEGGGYGIATVKTSVEVGATVEVRDSSEANRARAAVLELPGTVEGPKLPSARELRERLARAPAPPRRPRR